MFVSSLAWLYGVLAIASFFITCGMFKLGTDYWLEREREPLVGAPPPPPVQHDTLLAVIVSAGLHGAGGTIWWSVRTWDAVMNGRINPGSAPLFILFAAALYAAGKIGLVYSSKLNGKQGVWYSFIAISLLWSVIVWWGVIASW